ncbi:hypothetical protein DFH94DRAFT_755525 [Russula ochroleuca]|uniref:Transmembrane protein n=1 Tax=Russula ochroleuca TaxID=152965 RepID=A0A9P5MSI2_9AGAM|nr:hypothetical protein DFH94DRAFT_755525 [Russula ochroleuca]
MAQNGLYSSCAIMQCSMVFSTRQTNTSRVIQPECRSGNWVVTCGLSCGGSMFVIAIPLFHTHPRSWPLALVVFVVVCGSLVVTVWCGY